MPNLPTLYIKSFPLPPCVAGAYLETLLQAAQKHRAITEAQLQKIQTGLLALWAQEAGRYTMGESTSLPTEQAGELLHSIAYSLGWALKQQHTPAAALATLLTTPLPTLHKTGLHLLSAATATAKRLWLAAKGSRTATKSYHYNYLLGSGIPLFFKQYDTRFAAHHTPADIDYPLALPRWELCGVEYMQYYLQSLLHENRFINRLAPQRVHAVLRRHSPAYEDLPLNLFAPVLLCAVGCAATGADVAALELPSAALLPLAHQLKPLPTQKLERFLLQTAQKVCAQIGLGGPAQQYAANAAKQHTPQLQAALRAGNIGHFFGSMPSGPTAPKPVYTPAPALPAAALAAFCEELASCRYFADKQAMVATLQNPEDFAQALQAGRFKAEEYALLFKKLPQNSLPLLLHMAGSLPTPPAWLGALQRAMGQPSPK